MTTAGPDPVHLNAKAGKLSKAGDFRGAAKCYKLATLEADQVSIYFSNLAAAYLKLGYYQRAAHVADKALRLEPRALKARYRRALARKNLKLIPEALVDITSLLASDPNNVEGKTEFRALRRSGRRPLALEKILESASPHAYGSPLPSPYETIPGDPHQKTLPYVRWMPRKASSEVNRTVPVHRVCHACRKPMLRQKLKTCQNCHRVNYCSVERQRVEWPSHKQTCSVAVDANVTIRTGRRLSDHLYFRQHLLHYAVACFGPPKLPHEDHEFILMVVVDMVAVSAAKPTGQKRTTVKNIVAIPACIVPDEVLDTQRTLLKSMRDPRPVHSMWISTTGIYPKGEECRFRLNTVIADEIFMSASKLPNFSVDLYSHSYGLFRRVNVDRDFIFQSINDELRLDTNNHYQLEA